MSSELKVMHGHKDQPAGACPAERNPLVDQEVTEQRPAAHHLVRSQKMEAIGQLAAGVAHDFNNLLTVIHAHASLHLANTQLDKAVVESLRQISLTAERASELTRRLLAFSRKQAERVQTLDLGRTLARTEPVLRRILGDKIELSFISPAKLPPILGDGGAIEQIITNLVVNAREALPEGGRIAVAAEVVSLTADAVRGNPEARPGCFAALSVTDNGCGIPPELLSRVCEPFFTTKPAGTGTGLGLSTVYALVRQHQGWMEVTSAPGQGTTIRVHLPAMAQEPRGPSHTTLFIKRRSGTRGRENILIVEDDLVLRSLTAQTLRQQGYQILEAGSAQQAVEVWEGSGRAIDLLLADVNLPGGASGVELARQLLRKRKTLRTLFSTGHSTELMQESLILMEGVNFIQKPYDIQRLIETVRRCLDAVEVASGTTVSDAYEPFAEVPRPILQLGGMLSANADESAPEVAPASRAAPPVAVAP
jgi:two-component system, cell cycle sensor histidine kinase and response regulator CckA